MKARVKATGEIVEVVANGNYYDTTDNKERYYSHELDFQDTTDYWTRLEHQAAIAAMQGTLANADLLYSLCKNRGDCPVKVVAIEFANACAHALVEKYKNEERK